MVLSRPSVKSSSCFWSASIGLSFSFSLSLPFEWGEGRAFFQLFLPNSPFKTTSVSFNDMKRLFASAARRVGNRAALSLDGFAVVERGRRGGGDAKKESFLFVVASRDDDDDDDEEDGRTRWKKAQNIVDDDARRRKRDDEERDEERTLRGIHVRKMRRAIVERV